MKIWLKQYQKLRLNIIKQLNEYFYKKSYVLAWWLGWSDANNESDEYSDIDLFLCVDDSSIDKIFKKSYEIISQIWKIDFVSEIDVQWNQKWQYYHIEWTPESLLIEIWVIKKTKWMIFEEWHPYFKPKILFDKENIITFHPINKLEFLKNIQKFINIQKDLVKQSSRINTYINRNNFIEATNYYIKFIFLPLVAILRVKYTPYLYNWWRIHISRHFPNNIIKELEELMKFNSINDIKKNFDTSKILFLDTLNEIEKEWIDLK